MPKIDEWRSTLTNQNANDIAEDATIPTPLPVSHLTGRHLREEYHQWGNVAWCHASVLQTMMDDGFDDA
jgi:hypothetical protein